MRLAQLLSLVLLLGCAASGKPDTLYVDVSSRVSDGVYTSDQFGLKLPLPEGCSVVSDETERHLREVDQNLVAGEDSALKSAIDATEKTTFQLLTLPEFEVGTAVSFNPNLIRVAER